MLSRKQKSFIKSIQRGTVFITTGTTVTVTISTISMSKSRLKTTSQGQLTVDGAKVELSRGVLTNATTLTFTRFATTANTGIAWELVEFI